MILPNCIVVYVQVGCCLSLLQDTLETLITAVTNSTHFVTNSTHFFRKRKISWGSIDVNQHQPEVNQTIPFNVELPNQGIETVRRDGCPLLVKMLEKVLRLLFTTKDLSQVTSRKQSRTAPNMDPSLVSGRKTVHTFKAQVKSSRESTLAPALLPRVNATLSSFEVLALSGARGVPPLLYPNPSVNGT